MVMSVAISIARALLRPHSDQRCAARCAIIFSKLNDKVALQDSEKRTTCKAAADTINYVQRKLRELTNIVTALLTHDKRKG